MPRDGRSANSLRISVGHQSCFPLGNRTRAPPCQSACGAAAPPSAKASAIGPIVRRLTPRRSLTRCCDPSWPASSARTPRLAAGRRDNWRRQGRFDPLPWSPSPDRPGTVVPAMQRPDDFEVRRVDVAEPVSVAVLASHGLPRDVRLRSCRGARARIFHVTERENAATIERLKTGRVR